jgi:uncharacterized protein (TIGR00661 family)
MKILYAASNNQNARIQLLRFLGAMEGSQHQIKVAAFKKSSPKSINIDWTLDALLNIYRPDLIALHSDNLSIYMEQVKDFSPDLIISDLEYFTSCVANELNITLWQCSSSLINYALLRNEKYNLGLFKYHAHALNRDILHSQRMVNILDNSNHNFVYSHYGDMIEPPSLIDGFHWVRPYHRIAKDYVPCQHNITAAFSMPDKKVMALLKKYPDSVAFVDDPQETYQNVHVKDIKNVDEYYCNLKNSTFYVCQGQTSFLADAFYNGKFALVFPDYENAESITNSQLAQKIGIGRIMTYTDDLSSHSPTIIESVYSDSIKYLHEHIEEL